MAARTCTACSIRWSVATGCMRCPRCGAPTSYSTTTQAMTRREIYERYCVLRERERERRGDPSPETLGQLDARKLVKGWDEAREQLAGAGGS